MQLNTVPPTCISETCIPAMCLPGFAGCDGLIEDGCESNLTRDTRHCGACGRACGPDQSCSAGSCQ